MYSASLPVHSNKRKIVIHHIQIKGKDHGTLWLPWIYTYIFHRLRMTCLHTVSGQELVAQDFFEGGCRPTSDEITLFLLQMTLIVPAAFQLSKNVIHFFLGCVFLF
jgi:hypothetical protein